LAIETAAAILMAGLLAAPVTGLRARASPSREIRACETGWLSGMLRTVRFLSSSE
jgi:hypothetical protein